MLPITDKFDPLYRHEVPTKDRIFVVFNHIEAIDYAPDEMHETIRQAMLEERANPTQENKAKCFDILKSMLGEYWVNQREHVAKMIEEAQTA